MTERARYPLVQSTPLSSDQALYARTLELAAERVGESWSIACGGKPGVYEPLTLAALYRELDVRRGLPRPSLPLSSWRKVLAAYRRGWDEARGPRGTLDLSILEAAQ